MRELVAGLRDPTVAPRGTVSLAARDVVLQFIVSDLLARFHGRSPEIRVEIVVPGDTRGPAASVGAGRPSVRAVPHTVRGSAA